MKNLRPREASPHFWEFTCQVHTITLTKETPRLPCTALRKRSIPWAMAYAAFLMHTLRSHRLLVPNQMLSSVCHQTLLPPQRDWGSQSEWLKSYTCWVPECILFSSTNTCFWRKGVGPHMAKACVNFPFVPNTTRCFSLNKLVSWFFEDFIILGKGAKCEDLI